MLASTTCVGEHEDRVKKGKQILVCAERLAAKHKYRERYIKLCSQTYVTEVELPRGPPNPDDLMLLLGSHEIELARQRLESGVVAPIDVWLAVFDERGRGIVVEDEPSAEERGFLSSTGLTNQAS
jgi:hypothetical protein